MTKIKKIMITAAASFIGLGIAGLFTFAWTLSTNVMHPKYTCSEEHFIYCGDPSQLDLAFDDIAFKSADGTDLSGWYIPAQASDKAVIFVHGHGADRHEGMRWFKAVHGAGFNILVFDLRNSGANAQTFSTMGYFERVQNNP